MKLICNRRTFSTSLLVLLLSLTPFLGGCVLGESNNGTPMTAMSIDKITPGKSTRADITKLLGPPDEIVYSNKEHDPLFEKVYIYKRSKTRQTAMFLILFSTFRQEQRYDHAAVFFGENGLVEHVGSRLDSKEASYGMPW